MNTKLATVEIINKGLVYAKLMMASKFSRIHSKSKRDASGSKSSAMEDLNRFLATFSFLYRTSVLDLILQLQGFKTSASFR